MYERISINCCHCYFNEYKETKDITYKQIKINKQDLTRVLGNEGTLQVLDSNENI